jgi:hypothetical protein
MVGIYLTKNNFKMSNIETIPVCGRQRGNTTGATNGSETTYPSEVRALTPVFSGVPVTRLLFYVTLYTVPCAIGQTYQPSLGTDIFFAIAAFTYAPYSLNTVNSSGILNIDLLNTTAFNYCQKVRIFIIYFCNAEWSFSCYLRAVRFNGF